MYGTAAPRDGPEVMEIVGGLHLQLLNFYPTAKSRLLSSPFLFLLIFKFSPKYIFLLLNF